ncbi:MAG: alkaline phosphatase D family protein [Sphingomonas sp.]
MKADDAKLTGSQVDRRTVIAGAAAMGAVVLWAGSAKASRQAWRERRDLYPEGVASGDPEPHSVILWTRRPFADASRGSLKVEVSLDRDFTRVVSIARVAVRQESDWTCRVLAAGLKPATVYWYRFTDDEGNGSRIGRTITAPLDSDGRAVRFAFVSCQSVNEGAQNAFRRMIWEDEKAPAGEQLGFVLHLGDFIYEVVEYPDEVPHRYARTVYDLGRIPDGRKVGNFYVPTNLAGYRHVYRAHIADPDIQDARAHFPFVCIGDNHEFSWQGWQSFIQYGGKVEPAQPLRVAANQAWWEYIPSRVAKASGAGLEKFGPPEVAKAPITTLDDHGFGDEANNRAAVGSMTAYRAMRYGKHVDLILTDLHSYRMEDPTGRPEANDLDSGDTPFMFPQGWLEILDAGRDYKGGKPPAMIATDYKPVTNFRKDEAPVTVLGAPQKAWLKKRLTASRATWKIWGVTNGTLDMRSDPQNLPAGLMKKPWIWPDYGVFGSGDFSGALHERAEIYDLVRDHKVTGFVTVSRDRHSFWAGYAAKALPPAKFEPVGLSFITGSISAPGLAEATEYGLKKHPLRPLFCVERPGTGPEATINLTIKHGVKTALEYAASGDIAKARALSNPDVAPHLEFVDMGGHGYSVVTAAADAIETEFVCIPRPIKRATTDDGGPVRYRVVHRAGTWRAGDAPRMVQRVVDGDPKLSV